MAWFSNGEEGRGYQERYCNRCIHVEDSEGRGCPVWGLHLFYSHHQGERQKPSVIITEVVSPNLRVSQDRSPRTERATTVESMLAMLIPATNAECEMFTEVPLPAPVIR